MNLGMDGKQALYTKPTLRNTKRGQNVISFLKMEMGNNSLCGLEGTSGMTALDILCVIGFECLTDFYNGTEAHRPARNGWE